MSLSPDPDPKMDFKGLVVAGAGVGFSDTVVSYVTRYLGTFPPWIVKLVAGYLVRRFGERVHEQVPNFGVGMILAGIGDAARTYVLPMIPAGVAMPEAGYALPEGGYAAPEPTYYAPAPVGLKDVASNLAASPVASYAKY